MLYGSVLPQLRQLHVPDERVKREAYGIPWPKELMTELRQKETRQAPSHYLEAGNKSQIGITGISCQLAGGVDLDAGNKSQIGITGMSCQLAGGVDSPAILWKSFCSQIESFITSKPPQRWVKLCQDEGCSVFPGAFLMHLENTDSDNLDADAQFQLLLSVMQTAMTDSGFPFQIEPSLVGTFTAVDSERSNNLADSHLSSKVASTLRLGEIHCNFDFKCASGYLAMCGAMDHISNRTCQCAVVGGVALNTNPEPLVAMHLHNLLSVNGSIRALDQLADGTCIGEGAAALVLQHTHSPVSSYAAICGWASNSNAERHTGAVNEQNIKQAAISAISHAKLTVTEIGLCHLHATGNPAADSIELLAITDVLCQQRPLQSPLHLLVHKHLVGHTEPASGLVAVITTVLAMNHRHIPANVSLTRPVQTIPQLQPVVRLCQAFLY